MNTSMDWHEPWTGGVAGERLSTAYERVRDELLAQRQREHNWLGELSSSAVATATAVSVLALVERRDALDDTGTFVSEARESFLSELIVDGIHWLAANQNADGGWGDTDKSASNLTASLLAVAAFNLTGVPAKFADTLERAQRFIDQSGGIQQLRQHLKSDTTTAAAVLANCALAGMVPWESVPALPLERVAGESPRQRFFHSCVSQDVLPAFIAVGQARFFHAKPWNPISRYFRQRSIAPSLAQLQQLQPGSGGFLESMPQTSFVVMCLASSGHVKHPVTQAGLEFIVESVREDGSWASATDVATRNTALAAGALAAAGEEIFDPQCVQWLLGCQHVVPHGATGEARGAWACSDLSGAAPEVFDTSAALIALARFQASPQCDARSREKIAAAAARGIPWLVDLQQRDGSWPALVSGVELTAQAIRALAAWRGKSAVADDRIAKAIDLGLSYVAPRFAPHENSPAENSVSCTAQVLLTLRDLVASGNLQPATYAPLAERGVRSLFAQQNADGGWGSGPRLVPSRGLPQTLSGSSVEETSVAIEAILAASQWSTLIGKTDVEREEWPGDVERSLAIGLDWLVTAVEENRLHDPSPVGVLQGRLWYYEKLYPLIFAVSAPGQARLQLAPPVQRSRSHVHLA